MSRSSTYLATFQQYIRAGVQASLARVQAAEHIVPEVDRQQAWHILSFALNVPEVWDVTRDLLLALAPKMELAGFRDEWLPYLEQGVQASQEHGDHMAEAELALQIGILQRLVSKFDQARRWLIASIRQFAEIDNRQCQARALNELAWLNHLQHHCDEATQNVEQALALLNETNMELAMSYRVLGMIAIEREQWHDAEKLHHKALKLFEQQGDQRKIAWSIQNIAYSLRGQGRFEDAIAYYQRASELLDKTKDMHSWAMMQMNLGIAYFRSGEPVLAQKYHEAAQLIFQKLNDQLNLARNYTNIGLVCLAVREYGKAESSFIISADLFSNLGDKNWSLNAIDGLAMTYLATGRYDLAAKLLESAIASLLEIPSAPNYDYLCFSLNEHLQAARRGQGLKAICPP